MDCLCYFLVFCLTLFPRALAGHAIAALVLPKQSPATRPFARQSKDKDGAALSRCSLCNSHITTALLQLLSGYFLNASSSAKPPRTDCCLSLIVLTFLCTLWVSTAPPLCCFQGTCKKGERKRLNQGSSGHAGSTVCSPTKGSLRVTNQQS